MKKEPVTTPMHDLDLLITELRGLIQSARHATATTVNSLQVLTNFEIGRRIVEHEQKGAVRAEYGKELLKEISALLTEEFGKGFSRSNLEYMRKFFLIWHNREHHKTFINIGCGNFDSDTSAFVNFFGNAIQIIFIRGH